MIQRKSTFFLGIFIFVIPFLGFPTAWKTAFIILSGLFLVGLSIKIVIPKKSKLIRPRKKEKVTPVFVENMPISQPTVDGISKSISESSKTELL